MNYLELIPNPEAYAKLDVAECLEMLEFQKTINYLIDEGFIEIEEHDNEIRVYPTS